MEIHPQAVVDPKARLGPEVKIGPFSCIGPDVVVGAGTIIGPNVLIEKGTQIGEKCRVFHGASLGGDPQVAGFKDLPSNVVIGDHTEIREYVTIHRSMFEGGSTRVGSHCMLMAYSHLGHDCDVGDHVVIVNGTGLSGHVLVESYAFVSGIIGVHQRVRIGRNSMTGGFTALRQDVVPFGLVEGVPPELVSINSVGLRRSNFAPKVRTALKEAIRILKDPALNTSQALDRIGSDIEPLEEVRYLTEFIQNSSRGVIK